MERIKDRRDQSWSCLLYSIQRIDLLIVSFCGGGIYICLETMKFYYGINKPQVDLIKIAGILFLLAMILNFLSQHYGYKSNEQDYLMCEANLDAIDKKISKRKRKKYKCESSKYDSSSEKYNKITNALNRSSMYVMLTALVLLGAFFIIF